ncbi:MAG: HAD family hydrolase [Candidatus Polarisedimenticolia bacterium]
MTTQLVLFDVDGTLLDVGGSGRWAMTRAFEEVFELPDAEPFSRAVRFDGMTDPWILRAIARNAGVNDDHLARERGRLRSSFLSHLERRLAAVPGKRAMPGVVELLERLAGVSMAQVGLATGNIEPGARLKLGSVGLGGHFAFGGFGGDADDRAGIGRVARERCEARLGRAIPPSDVVLVGDSEEDVRAAHANGYRALAVGTGWVAHEVLRAMEPDLFVDDLSDFGAIMQFIFGSRG